MKKIVKQKPQDEQSISILKNVAKRVEDATIDIHSIKRDLKFVNLSLGQVERNTEVMKIDIERLKNEMGEMKLDIGGLKTDISIMKKGIKEIKRDTEGLIETTAHILKNAITLDEHNDLSQRVSALEQS